MESESNPNGETEPAYGFRLLDESHRQRFILKVFGTLTLQLLILMLLTAMLLFVTLRLQEYKIHPFILPILATVLFPGVFVSLAFCCGDLKKKSPQNTILFIVFTLIEGFSAATAIFVLKTHDDVLLFSGSTLVVLVFLTLFTFQNKLDFTVLTGLAVVILVFCFLCGFNFLFLAKSYRTIRATVAGVFALLFSALLVWDTTRVVQIGGKHKFTPDDVIWAALTIQLYMFSVCYVVVFAPAYSAAIFGTLDPFQLLPNHNWT